VKDRLAAERRVVRERRVPIRPAGHETADGAHRTVRPRYDDGIAADGRDRTAHSAATSVFQTIVTDAW
jgi:hypothetical protein